MAYIFSSLRESHLYKPFLNSLSLHFILLSYEVTQFLLQDLNEIAAKNPTVKIVKIGTIFFENFQF